MSGPCGEWQRARRARGHQGEQPRPRHRQGERRAHIALVHYDSSPTGSCTPQGPPYRAVRAPRAWKDSFFFRIPDDNCFDARIKELVPGPVAGYPPMLGDRDAQRTPRGAAQMIWWDLQNTGPRPRRRSRCPTASIFDLTPVKASAGDRSEATELTHRLLDMLGLDSFLKERRKGLHGMVTSCWSITSMPYFYRSFPAF